MNSLVCAGKVLVKELLKPLLTGAMIVSLCGCQALRTPVELSYKSGAVVQSLTSNASLSYTSPARSISGSGVLMYRKPDQVRAVILSPFGSVLQEVYISGEQVTIMDVGNSVAFRGSYRDLPVKGDVSGWRYIYWLIDIDPPDPSGSSAQIERINKYGQREKAVFENGLLVAKNSAAGGNVKYARYTAVNGVAVPLEIIYETVAGEFFTIKLEEPEINQQLADTVFIPNLGKFRVYPLSRLK